MRNGALPASPVAPTFSVPDLLLSGEGSKGNFTCICLSASRTLHAIGDPDKGKARERSGQGLSGEASRLPHAMLFPAQA